jgi:hypothetical protein
MARSGYSPENFPVLGCAEPHLKGGSMRRITVVIASVLLLSLAADVALAKNAFIGPGNVEKGESVTISAKNCQDGPGFKAFVKVEVLKKKKVKSSRTQPADADGVTVTDVKMGKVGTYTIRVTCIHRFDAGGEGIFWEESKKIKVTERG